MHTTVQEGMQGGRKDTICCSSVGYLNPKATDYTDRARMIFEASFAIRLNPYLSVVKHFLRLDLALYLCDFASLREKKVCLSKVSKSIPQA